MMTNRFSISDFDKIKLLAAHLFFPNTCMICNTPIEYDSCSCEKCANYPDSIGCSKYSYQSSSGDLTVISPFEYGKGAERCIWALKFDGIRINGRKLGCCIAAAVKSSCKDKIDLIIPIPMYKADEYKRGYNQSAIIAQDISRRINVAASDKLLVKIRQTQKQHTLDKKQREVNLKDCFEVTSRLEIEGKTILLVDDVLTTGATAREAVKLLMANGAKKVICAVGAIVRSKTLQLPD